MPTTPFDARSVANLMLDESDRQHRTVSNLALQKLIYFAHGIYLCNCKTPLVSGYFEAWQYGPVHPGLYAAFKTAGASPITFRADSIDVFTGEVVPLENPKDATILRVIGHVVATMGGLSTANLVNISHAKGSPWSYVIEKSKDSVAFGMRIPDIVILERFKHHKVSLGGTSDVGDTLEDSPFA